jgi:hypothetical protein
MPEEVLLETVNPNGNVQAVVQSEGDVCYFYLFGAPDTGFPTKSLWVRNYLEAPESLDVEGMKNGKPPLNPAVYCRHPIGLAAPDPESLRVVWLPEGNGAALYEEDELLAIIPPVERDEWLRRLCARLHRSKSHRLGIETRQRPCEEI